MPTPLKIIVYPVFALFCFIIFSIILFPFESIKTRISHELESALGGGYSISVENLSPSLLSGVVLKNVVLRPRGFPEASPIKFSRAKLKFPLIPLLSGATKIDFDLKAEHGRAQGAYTSKKTGFVLDLKMDHCDVALVGGLLMQKPVVPAEGLVNGTVQLDIAFDDPLHNSGLIALESADVRLKEMSLGGGALQLPVIQLAKNGGALSKVNVAISRGNFEIKEFKFSGGDLDFQSEGKIYGARSFDNYRFNIKGAVKPSTDLAGKIPLLTLPILDKQKSPDGSYPFTITGRVSVPSIRIGDFKVPL